MAKRKELLNEIKDIYKTIGPWIESRLKEFDKIWKTADERDLFTELSFCLFTPQSGARVCWDAVNSLIDRDLLFNGCCDDIREQINTVRFRNNKSGYLVEARERFIEKGESLRDCLNGCLAAVERREWLVKNIKGLGYKEASHYLRNIGLGADIAILDRHILRNMVYLGLIKEVPKSISPVKYLELEKKLEKFARSIDIPLSHLDFVLWYKETGDIFK